ncbi:hypothetical protein [Pseudochrobactrum sp. HB0163]|uniref:hypothetical protein n=1 Tax=Pseudochrobactrum sp. HB0163 TaxID=3450708 RepID=UPI003F6DF087
MKVLLNMDKIICQTEKQSRTNPGYFLKSQVRNFLGAAGFLAVLALGGCAGVNYVQAKYQGLPSVEFVGSSGVNYRIVDNPQQNRLLIGPGTAGTVTQNFVKGFSTGSGLNATPPVVLRDVAEEYLKSTGKRCETRDITLVVDPYYEVRYKCSLRGSRMAPLL